MDKQIRMACIYADVSHQQLCAKLGMSPASFSQKLKRNSWSVPDLRQIADALDCELQCGFVFPDGKAII
jgi:hypothetical protein